MAGFEYRGQLNGAENPVLLKLPIANSATVKVGDAVYTSSAGVTRATNGTLVLGIVVGIVDANGIDLDNTASSNYDGTWTSSSKTYVASSDNLTNKKIHALVNCDENSKWYNDADGDFTDPGDVGLLIKCADQDQIDEDTTSATVGQFFVLQVNPDGDNASECIVKIARSQLNGWEPET